MDAPVAAESLIGALRRQAKLRANSAIITLFGDAILPRGGNIWLGSLIALAASLGVAERRVRTGVYRLSRQGWLTSRGRGRRAYYTLTPSALENFHEALQRIHSVEKVTWDGEWQLVQLPADLAAARRSNLRRELGWLGFGQIGAGLFAHPSEDMAALSRVLARHGLSARSLVFRARLADFVSSEHIRKVVATAWKLDALNQDYGRFLKSFTPVANALEAGLELSDEHAFILRILLMHEYRRLLLKDPVLPEPLMPADWLGGAARELTVAIYCRVAAAADRHLVAHLETYSGNIPPLDAAYWQRFGGLAP
ncbi:MAG: phenylacetic acid degradation operon negative regulatory protein PaaX [Hyphomicrobiales bacterium]|nr:phenylacetic acid degradation operon negative regulatory protein PaaX [Hyphomicrobiales bacterium]